MNQVAYKEIKKLWNLTIKARALCPMLDESMVGEKKYTSAPWYFDNGALYFVQPAQKLTSDDIKEMNEIGNFINRSFIISIIAVLEEHGVIPLDFEEFIDSRKGADYVKLSKWLRNRFAHGEYEYDKKSDNHVETWELICQLFPERQKQEASFNIPIDSVLEGLKNGVLEYIEDSF